ncbi:GNAT family N-acetyltransferase [Alicyclobacillus fastidiosus]|uniref:GNAT family N-acetyltransferase n=1 Tax=Alicyclobacillus fastidiosus TaxID=392011 RepID=A0ABV5ABM3_9BACL|nr:GNAT family N-acetyltransferase [Alicyclobacillus fastidiosus]WEH10365.1 GNAT family N-acetyltransferase [Alicyclobacillus fastidiosus]
MLELDDDPYHTRALASSDVIDMRELTEAVGWSVAPWRLGLYQNVAHALGVWRGETLVATIAAFRLGAADISIGQLIVHPSVQRQGLGRRLLQTVLDHCPNDHFRLIATSAGFPLYSDMGFSSAGEVWRMECDAWDKSGRDPTNPVQDERTTSAKRQGDRDLPSPFQALRPEHVTKLSDLDRNYTGLCRAALFQSLVECGETSVISHGHGSTWHCAALALMERGVMRLGPLLAPTEEAAVALLQDAAACAKQAGIAMRVDAYAHHELLLKTACQLGFQVKMQSPFMTLSRGDHPSPCNLFFCFDPAVT